GEGMDAVFFLWADQPLLDPRLAQSMLESFRRYRAEYCFADGYPVGLAAEILSPRIVPALRTLAGSLPPEPARDSLFAVIQKDINSFDIETSISKVDLRDLRLALVCDTKRNMLLVERLMAAGVRDESSANEIIPRRLDLLRSLPAFVQVQLTGGCPQTCSLCPYPQFGGDILARRDVMDRVRFGSLLDQVQELSGDAVIDFSLWGEPSLHPEIEALIEDTLSRPEFSLIVETSGIGWDRSVVERIAGRHQERLSWIVSLDAWSPELYSRLRGPGYSEAVGFAEYLISQFPRGAYVQCVRAKENEAELEAFWRGWKQKTENVIVQKYSSCAGFLPERRVSDLSPIVRRPCWHLKRDLSILLDGSVPLCRECVRKEVMLGNAFEPGGLRAAWEAGEPYHLAHVQASLDPGKAYPGPCTVCDEYYTYNA
ncbi:MAG TPA: spiro-SPASM protein, partial [Rectinemataceae bacterium]|nr:spiro-SPASM protein [Rectinemataceae bacterium]